MKLLPVQQKFSHVDLPLTRPPATINCYTRDDVPLSYVTVTENYADNAIIIILRGVHQQLSSSLRCGIASDYLKNMEYTDDRKFIEVYVCQKLSLYIKF